LVEGRQRRPISPLAGLRDLPPQLQQAAVSLDRELCDQSLGLLDDLKPFRGKGFLEVM